MFKNQAQTHIGKALETLYEIQADITLENVYHLLSNPEDMNRAIKELAEIEKTERRKELIEHFNNRFLSQPSEQLGGVRETIANYLQYFLTPEMTQVFCAPATNRGKRHAQDAALARCRSNIVVTIDSDTEIASDGVTQIVRPFVDDRIGAVTGDVAVTNRSANILTRLIGMRYWVAFNQERAAQSYFRSVLCCSGPFSAYRRSVLTEIWPAYISQTFRGTACTYGDDRHLTNLILADGSQTLFLPQAQARTNAPETIRGYLTQQLRWNKSFYREVLWTLPFLSRLGAYIAFEMSVQVLLPLLLTVLILSSTLVAILLHPAVGVRYVAVTAMMGLLRCSYAIYRTRDPRFLMFLLYGFIHVFLLIPVRIRALLTLTDNRWGTRTAVASGPAHDELADRLADAV